MAARAVILCPEAEASRMIMTVVMSNMVKLSIRKISNRRKIMVRGLKRKERMFSSVR